MLNGPKNGLTYTQNDREKWRNTFTMIVSASLHVLVTEKVQQASTITLAPRCSHASDSPGPAMVEFLSNPFIPCNLRPKYLKTGGVYPPIRRAQCDQRGPPKRRSPVPRGAALCRCPGASHPAILGGWWGHIVPNPQKSYLRLVWHQYVVGGGCGCTPVPKKKNGENGKTQFPTLLDRIFARPYLQTGMRTPVFFAFIAKSTSNSTQKCEKKISHFLDPPPEKNFFPAMPSSKSPKLRSFLYSSHK